MSKRTHAADLHEVTADIKAMGGRRVRIEPWTCNQRNDEGCQK